MPKLISETTCRKYGSNQNEAQILITLNTTALALNYSAAEYSCLVWFFLAHAKQVDVALIESYRIFSGCLKPTTTQKLYTLWHSSTGHKMKGKSRRRMKEIQLWRKTLLHGNIIRNNRLKPRHSFLHST